MKARLSRRLSVCETSTVISDSVPWRGELLKTAEALERRASLKRWTTRTGFLVERDLMVGMFAIRLLVESAKTSSLLPSERVSFGMHPLAGSVPGIYDRWSYWEYYDMDSKPDRAHRSRTCDLVHPLVRVGVLPRIRMRARENMGRVRP